MANDQTPPPAGTKSSSVEDSREDAAGGAEEETEPCLSQRLPRRIRHVAWLLPVSRFFRACPPPTHLQATWQALQDFLDHVLVTWHQLLAGVGVTAQVLLSFDQVPLLPLHQPLPLTPDECRELLAHPTLLFLEEAERAERLLTSLELRTLPALLAECLSSTVHWQWLRHVATCLQCPVVLNSLDLMHVPAPAAAGGLPSSDEAYRQLLTDMTLQFKRSMYAQTMTDLVRDLPSEEERRLLPRRLAAHLIGQQWATLNEPVVRPLLNNPALAGIEALHSSAAVVVVPGTPATSSKKKRATAHRSERRQNHVLARLVTKLPRERWEKLFTRLPDALSAATERLRKAERTQWHDQGNSLLNPTPRVQAPELLAEEKQWRDQAASTTMATQHLEAPDLIGSKHTRLQQRLAADSLGQLMPQILHVLGVGNGMRGVVVLLCPGPEVLVHVIAALATTFAFAGTNPSPYNPYAQENEHLPRRRCFLALSTLHPAAPGQAVPITLLDVGLYYNRLVKGCQRDLPGLALGDALLTWVMVALMSRQDEGLEEALWDMAQVLDTSGESLFEKTARSTLPRLNMPLMRRWFFAAHGLVYGKLVPPPFTPPVLDLLGLLTHFQQASSSSAAGNNGRVSPAVLEQQWTQFDVYATRLLHTAVDYVPHAHEKSLTRYLLETFIHRAPGKDHPLGLALDVVQSGRALLASFNRRRLLVQLEFTAVGAPIRCWTAGENVAPALSFPFYS